jgi:DNA-binding transcriptional LysR family regulator
LNPWVHRAFIPFMDGLHAIDMNLLVTFHAILAERSVTRAGARIGRTQPAMSAALARLRHLFQDELFVRGPKGLEPTPRALDLAEPIAKCLRFAEEALSLGGNFDPRTSLSTLRIGLSDHPAAVLLPRLLAGLRQAAPGIDLDVHGYAARDQQMDMLEAGEIDVSIGVQPRTNPRILSQPLFEESFVCILRSGHPAAKGPLALKTFVALEHLLVSPEGERFGHVDQKLAELGLRRRLGLTLPQMNVAPAVVAETDLIATLMRGVVDGASVRNRLALFEPPIELPKVSFVMCWHRRSDAHPGQRWFRELLRGVSAKFSQDRKRVRQPSGRPG